MTPMQTYVGTEANQNRMLEHCIISNKTIHSSRSVAGEQIESCNKAHAMNKPILHTNIHHQPFAYVHFSGQHTNQIIINHLLLQPSFQLHITKY